MQRTLFSLLLFIKRFVVIIIMIIISTARKMHEHYTVHGYSEGKALKINEKIKQSRENNIN